MISPLILPVCIIEWSFIVQGENWLGHYHNLSDWVPEETVCCHGGKVKQEINWQHDVDKVKKKKQKIPSVWSIARYRNRGEDHMIHKIDWPVNNNGIWARFYHDEELLQERNSDSLYKLTGY